MEARVFLWISRGQPNNQNTRTSTAETHKRTKLVTTENTGVPSQGSEAYTCICQWVKDCYPFQDSLLQGAVMGGGSGHVFGLMSVYSADDVSVQYSAEDVSVQYDGDDVSVLRCFSPLSLLKSESRRVLNWKVAAISPERRGVSSSSS